MSTEEDGVDEAGRTTQSPLIMAPPSLKADPDGEAAEPTIDNGTMASSRNRIGGSRSGVSNGDSSASIDEDATEAGLSTAASAAPAATVRAAASPSASSEAETGSSYSRSSYTGTSSYSSSASASPSGHSRSAWAASADASASSSTSAPPAGAGGAGSTSPSGNGYSSGNGSSSSAASAVTGAAAGLAASVSSAWQKRGSGKPKPKPRPMQTRKSTKRQAMLTLARVEPWSVMKFSFVASVVAFIILFVAVAVLYMVLSALGVFDSLQHTVSSITSSQSDAGTNISHWFSASLILGYTAMLGALNIVLITAMSTVGSVIYNLIAKTIGGIEVTLRETD